MHQMRIPFHHSEDIKYLHDHQTVYIPNTDKEYSATALVAMLLGNIKRNVIATIKRLSDGDETSTDNLHFIFAVPPNYPESTCNALKDASLAASVDSGPHAFALLVVGECANWAESRAN